VNSNRTNYKILHAESNKRNEKFLRNKIRRGQAELRSFSGTPIVKHRQTFPALHAVGILIS
jgi:hypothetical protein